MFPDWEPAPLNHLAPQCAFQVVRSTCELPSCCVGARHGAAEETQAGLSYLWHETQEEQNGLKPPFHASFCVALSPYSEPRIRKVKKRSPGDVSFLQFYEVRKIRILYLILTILQ